MMTMMMMMMMPTAFSSTTTRDVPRETTERRRLRARSDAPRVSRRRGTRGRTRTDARTWRTRREESLFRSVAKCGRPDPHTSTRSSSTSTEGMATKTRAPAVGFLGLGIMGAAMARTLARSGVRVAAWNRSSDKAKACVDAFEREDRALAEERGGSIATVECPSEIAGTCEVTFAMLADPRAAVDVARAYAAGLDGAGGGGTKRTYVDCSTVDGACGEATMDILGRDRVQFLAAPVSGGWRDAAKGELLFIGGGSRQAYEAASKHMDVMGAKRWLVGDTPTHAARAKLMLQIMMGNVIGALGEMHSLSQRAGLDSSAVLEMLSHSAMGSPLTTAKGKLMESKDFSPNFQVYLQQKDLRLALQLADELDFAAPITAATNAQYLKAKSLGYANSDFAAVAAAYTDARSPSRSE